MNELQTDMIDSHKSNRLPWATGNTPLMLAPMQGLTNRAMRALFIDWVRPDVVFTEFMRVGHASRKGLIRSDRKEASSPHGDVPMVAQLVGHSYEALVIAAQDAQEAGVEHLNLNLGCPYGRTTSGATGGALLQHIAVLEKMIPALRAAIHGTFSIKVRSGYSDPQQIFSLLPLFEQSGVDFLIIHPRTVVQQYQGLADHTITQKVVEQCSLPVIANGDIRTAAAGRRLLQETGAAGLMLGRGAINDPLLFERLRNPTAAEPTRAEQAMMLQRYMRDLLSRYSELFCGEVQVLNKLKKVLTFVEEPAFAKQVTQMKRTKTIEAFTALVEELA